MLFLTTHARKKACWEECYFILLKILLLSRGAPLPVISLRDSGVSVLNPCLVTKLATVFEVRIEHSTVMLGKSDEYQPPLPNAIQHEARKMQLQTRFNKEVALSFRQLDAGHSSLFAPLYSSYVPSYFLFPSSLFCLQYASVSVLFLPELRPP